MIRLSAITPYATMIKWSAIALVLVALAAQTVRLADERARHAETRTTHVTKLRELSALATKASEAARAAEQAQARAFSAIDHEYQQERADAQLEHDRVVAGLRAGTVRLQDRWAGCVAASTVPASRATAGNADAATRDREASAGRIVQAAAECEAQVRGLQALVRAYMERAQ